MYLGDVAGEMRRLTDAGDVIDGSDMCDGR